jgi:hypothetical protein
MSMQMLLFRDVIDADKSLILRRQTRYLEMPIC